MEKRVVCISVPHSIDFIGTESLLPNGFVCSKVAEMVPLTEYGIGDYLVGKWQGVTKILRSAKIGSWIAYCSAVTSDLQQNHIATRILCRLGFDTRTLYGPVVITKATKEGLSDRDLAELDGIDVLTVPPPKNTKNPAFKRSSRFCSKRRKIVVTTPARIEGHNDSAY